jgi:alginate O-acetyltransferase complex protein AlgI
LAFNSYVFVVFLAFVVAAYNLAPRRFRPSLLLLSSYLFYAYSYPTHLAWLVLVTGTAYLGGLLVAKDQRRIIFAIVIVLVLLPLIITKYYDFGVHLVSDVSDPRRALGLVLPIGISFYTFQAVSYVADVYRGAVVVEREFGQVALYLAFFPQILAGPIERARRLLPQIRSFSNSTNRGLYEGGKYLVWGFFCKLVIADNVATIVDRIVSTPTTESGASLSIAFILYSFQIYFDFLGYTNIAIGVARLFGVRLSRNFRRPYGATSLRDFWRRWHITLSSWFRDYLYIPLGGRATRGGTRVRQILAVFMLSGLWHGAALNFVAWGGIHGVAYLVEDQARRLWRPMRRRRLFTRPIRVAVTFCVVTLAWVFFRMSALSDISIVLQRMFLINTDVAYWSLNDVLRQRDSVVFMSLLFTAIVLDSSRRARAIRACAPPSTLREVVAELMFVNWIAVTLLLFGDAGARDFIYFRF